MKTRTNLTSFSAALLASLLALAGCTVGQRYGYADATLPLERVSSGASIGLAVPDAIEKAMRKIGLAVTAVEIAPSDTPDKA